MAGLKDLRKNSGRDAGKNKLGYVRGDSLIFPTKFNPDSYPECIKFSIYERTEVELAKAAGALDKGFGRIKDSFNFGGAEERQKSKKELEAKKGTLSTSEQEELARFKKTDISDKAIINKVRVKGDQDKNILQIAAQSTSDGFEAIGSDLKARNTQIQPVKLINHIYLNMPNDLAFNEPVSWEGSELGGVIGGLVSGGSGTLENLAAGSAGTAATAFGAGVGTVLGSMSMFSKIGKFGGMVAGAIGGGTQSGSLQAGFESVVGVKSNPYKEQTFQGIDFRNFSFNFIFRAKSEADVNAIQEIIQHFRAYSKPSFYENRSGLFNYPHEFQIEFLTIDENDSFETNENLPSLKYCVCTGVNTNFSSGGWKSFQGGAPVEITLELSFTETELITQNDIFGNTEVGRFKKTERNF
jgi:hypothetical protein